MTTTQAYLQTWIEARTRFTNLLSGMQETDLTKKLLHTKNSAGFLIRHIGDVVLLFSKNVKLKYKSLRQKSFIFNDFELFSLF